MTACGGDDGQAVSKDDMGEWPLAVDKGRLSCENPGGPRSAASSSPEDGTNYTVNGTAKSPADYPDVDEIWADDPDVDGLKINMGTGHGGKSGRWERLHEVAETYGFVLTQVDGE